MPIRVFLIDDDQVVGTLCDKVLRKAGFETTRFSGAEAALADFENTLVDVIITDIEMPGMNGIELCARTREIKPDVPVLLLTSHGRFENAVEAMRAGAYDFLTKPVQPDSLVLATKRAAEHHRLRDEVTRLQNQIESAIGTGAILGDSSAIRKARTMLSRVADTDVTVLLQGETGTGKEVFVHELHRMSRRKKAPLVTVNCAAVPQSLLESELFGHVKGAFTDARSAKRGLFLEADGGTLFLDEIGEIPLAVQPKLLRVLQERTVRPVGSAQEIPIDVRLVTATHRDLEEAVKQGEFREDLYFRVHVLKVELPALRERENDVLTLAQHFVNHFAQKQKKNVVGITPEAALKMTSYPWPGNVRELQNCVESALALTQYDRITVSDLPERVQLQAVRSPNANQHAADKPITLDELERRYIFKIIDSVNGNKTVASQILGLDRATLYRKLERYAAQGLGPQR